MDVLTVFSMQYTRTQTSSENAQVLVSQAHAGRSGSSGSLSQMGANRRESMLPSAWHVLPIPPDSWDL